MSKVAIVMSLALTSGGMLLALSHAPPRVLRASAVGERIVAYTSEGAAACQDGEMLPANASAVRLGLGSSVGPAVRVRAYAGTRLLTEGEQGSSWSASTVTVPIKSLRHSASHVKLCVEVLSDSERLQIYGVRTASREGAVSRGGQTLPGRMSVEYLGLSPRDWWSRVPEVARHMGLGHAMVGSWVALLVAALAAVMAAFAVGLAWREIS